MRRSDRADRARVCGSWMLTVSGDTGYIDRWCLIAGPPDRGGAMPSVMAGVASRGPQEQG